MLSSQFLYPKAWSLSFVLTSSLCVLLSACVSPGRLEFEKQSDAAQANKYPVDPNPLNAQACLQDHAAFWQIDIPEHCLDKRSCIDSRQRFWVDAQPFIPRGVYDGGRQINQLLENCPADAACADTNPKDAHEYVDVLLSAGINVILENVKYMPEALREAITASEGMKLAHTLWNDPFSEEGNTTLASEISEVAENPNLIFWFGPDEAGMWNTWSMAAGMKRILHGNSSQIDALLNDVYQPGNDAYLPTTQEAADPYNLPYPAALVMHTTGLAIGTRLYDILMPVSYTLQEPYSLVNEGAWGTWRIDAYSDQGAPMMPVLQMVGIESMGLSQPNPEQIEAQIMSAWAKGAHGAFYYKLAGDTPKFAGRDGYFAADDTQSWDAFARMHARQDALIPVVYSDAQESRGDAQHLEWRRWSLDNRDVWLITNPTPFKRQVDLETLLNKPDDAFIRHYENCESFSTPEFEFPAYGAYVLEVYR